jgi:exo-beta-1,3-glucanase (GH17 family)
MRFSFPWFRPVQPASSAQPEERRRARRKVPVVEGVEVRLLLSGGSGPTAFLGVAYQPYVKQWYPNKIDGRFATPPWNSYTTGNASVMNQLKLISQNFNSVATYASGWFHWNPPVPFNKLNSNVLVATDAAEINKQAKSLKLTVSQGIFQQDNSAAWKSEIETAIKITKAANQIYPGTVTRLVFTNEYLDTPARIERVMNFIKDYRSQVPGVQVGVRVQNLGVLNDSNRPALREAMTKLVKSIDFVMVNIYPDDKAMAKGPAAGVAEVATQYNALKAMALKVNPSVKVIIGETGWPSQGVSFNDKKGQYTNVANEQAYYNQFKAWANQKAVPSYFFEAIDEPFKSDKNRKPTDAEPWKTGIGAEGHFGLYTYSTTTDSGTFTAKFPL